MHAFNEHNGNEACQSFHGLPPNYVQPIFSPATFDMNPMQINTRNPDGSGKRGGPLPRASAAPPNASYSGLLECPCSTRRKFEFGGHVTRAAGTCGADAEEARRAEDPWASPHDKRKLGDWPVGNATECFEAAASLFGGSGSNMANYFGKAYSGKRLRNSFDGQVGFEFQTVANFEVLALGRATYNDKALQEDVVVTIWDAKTRQPVVQTAVGPSSPMLDAYAYEELAASVPLLAGKKYRITQMCTNGMADVWDDEVDDSAPTSPVAAFGQGVFSSGTDASAYPDQEDGNHRRPGMVTFFVKGSGTSNQERDSVGHRSSCGMLSDSIGRLCLRGHLE